MQSETNILVAFYVVFAIARVFFLVARFALHNLSLIG